MSKVRIETLDAGQGGVQVVMEAGEVARVWYIGPLGRRSLRAVLNSTGDEDALWRDALREGWRIADGIAFDERWMGRMGQG